MGILDNKINPAASMQSKRIVDPHRQLKCQESSPRLNGQIFDDARHLDFVFDEDERTAFLLELDQDRVNNSIAQRTKSHGRAAMLFAVFNSLFQKFNRTKPMQNGVVRGGHRVPFVLRPMHMVEPYAAEDAIWRSLGDDPYFHLSSRSKKKYRGWYMVELIIKTSGKHGNAKFYFDFGDGFSENDVLSMEYRSGTISKRLYYFRTAPRRIRFDPMDFPCFFRVDHLRIIWVPGVFAVSRMINKLKAKLNDYQHKARKDIKREIKAEAGSRNCAFIDLLYERYSTCFDYRFYSRSYEEWITKTERPGMPGRDRVIDHISNFSSKPLISILLPTFNSNLRYLRRCIDSVLNQSYPNWQLCIADDCSRDPGLKVMLDGYAQRDSRIRITYRKNNGHISAASNSALKMAEGDFVALLDHDDELSEHALFFIAEAINGHADVQMIYSDEDKIDARGNRSEPHFKSDFNPDLLFSQNYISHLGVYKKELVEKIGGFRQGVEGSQDYDLLLRCIAQIDPAQILHIPKVLYHWRAVDGSTAFAGDEKRYTTAAGILALRHYFEITRQKASVGEGLIANTYRVTYPIVDPKPLVSLLIPTRDAHAVLSRCISSILEKTVYPNYEIIILDNASMDPASSEYLESIQKHGNIKVLSYNYPFNFSAINNFGAAHAAGGILGFINNDVEVISPEWLSEMVSHACRPEIGCVGAKLYYPNNQIQHAGIILGIGGVAGHSHKYFFRESPGYFSRLMATQNFSAVTAACMLVRKEIFERVHGFNETELAIAFNDVDFCLKVQKAGFRNLWTPYAELYHHESFSRGAEDDPDKQSRFKKEVEYMQDKWGRILDTDKYYSPHLTRIKEDFSLA